MGKLFVKGMNRFKSLKKLSIKVNDEWLWMSFPNARELVQDLNDMLTGDLVQTKVKPCGCVKRIRSSVKAKRTSPISSQWKPHRT